MSHLTRRILPNSLSSLRKPCIARSPTTRLLTTTTSVQKWKGSTGKDHITNGADSHNVQQDAVMAGKKERGEVDRSRGISEQSGGSNQKARQEFPEAPDTVGMQDERGQKKGDA
ncbi:uncharacterized protein BP5553_03550 [Venustampulla echinocandica]|uniref:Uncharacterized protein n=1 Tax=Venustampulla echinocandica TaxID=2656787 RepID=A0A370TUN4_9HELO|nr:uncharacterized protein BP5553_03550 [Venustampulla echinocandica]RDL39210.1 hypothetical protein BP5553_03550 [Venustampulla echinocandica]